MLIYCSHKYGGDSDNIRIAGQKIHDLQVVNPQDTYISPLHMFSFLRYGEIKTDLELCLDVLKRCDKMVVLSGDSPGVLSEIKLANELGIEIEYMR